IARVQFTAGQLAEGRGTLEQAMGADPASATTWNNLGTGLAVSGDLAGASTPYEHALPLPGTDGGILVNPGLVQYALGDTAAADGALAKGIQQGGGIAGACALLGLAPVVDSSRGGAQKMTEAEMRELLIAAFRKIPAPAARPQTSTATIKSP